MVSASRGVPVTAYGVLLKVRRIRNSSPEVRTPPGPLAPEEKFREATVGAAADAAAAPFTVKSESSVTAWVPRERAASLALSRIVPPFRVSAEAATLRPFASASPEATA